MNRQEKALRVKELQEKASRAGAAIITDFKGMTVENTDALRVELRKVGVDYVVVKNTLARIALKDTDHTVLLEVFNENCAIAFGYDDPVGLAKSLVDYAKGNKKLLIKSGSLEGKYLEADAINALAKLPSRPELLSSVLGTMNAVPTNLVGVLANVPRNFLYALNAIRDQKAA